MADIKRHALELIGNTPLMKIDRFMPDTEATVLAKLEYLNPAGSTKDRAALYMIEDAEEKGLLKKGATIIEPTSGNTGIGMAMVAAIKGYQVILTLPETMSIERRQMLQAYGAKLVLTDGSLGMNGAISKAKELQNEIEGSVILGQFENPANARAHEETTGPEIWEQTDGEVDILVAGVGTGGTLTGIASYLKMKNPKMKIIAVEPKASPVLSGGKAGAHGLQGIGANFVPELLDTSLIDEIIAVSEEDAYVAGRTFAHREGILVGISSGAVLAAAQKVAKQAENQGKTVVVVLPDSGDRYLSTPMFC